MLLKKAFCVFAIFFLLIIPSLWAKSLLEKSLETAHLDELQAMAVSFALDSSGDEETLRVRLLDYFDISREESSESFVSTDKGETTIAIENANTMFILDNVVVMSGDVKLSFTDSSNTKKILTASKVVVDMDLKAIEASGDVVLDDTASGARKFTGKSVFFDWSSLDVVVFEGISSTQRKNAAGTNVSLYASGDTISYSGEQNIVFFNEGVIFTAQTDPYWSIRASKVSFSGADVFIDSAVLKLGRVPIMYFPFFFYPGTTIAFNPAIGLSSDKGAFLNTTTELYGVYEKKTSTSSKSSSSTTSSSSSSSSSDDSDTDYTASLLSLLDSGDSSEKVRDGWYYRNLEEGESLSDIETWARKTSSYFAIFADAYEKLGLVAGFDTSNKLFNNSLTIDSLGAVGYNASDSTYANKFRYYIDLKLSFKFKNILASISAPLFSDYLVKSDFLNRNTRFGLDSVFGSEQEFPRTYSSIKDYSWTATANASGKIGNVSLNLSKLSAQIDYQLDRTTVDGKYVFTPKIKSASLPEISFSSNGSWTVLQSKSSKTSDVTYSNSVAKKFSEELTSLKNREETTTGDNSEKLSLNFYNSPTTKTSSSSSSSGFLKLGYTFNQSFNNKYSTELVPSSVYSKSYGTVFFNVQSPAKWIAVNETVKPTFSFSSDFTQKSDDTLSYKNVQDLSFVSNLVVESQLLGLTYKLSNKIYSSVLKDQDGTITQDESKWGEWEKDDVTEHSLEFKKSLSYYTFSLKGTFKPVTESFKPSVAFSKEGFTLNADISFIEKDDVFEKNTSNLKLGYSNSFLNISLSNAFDFTKYDELDLLSAYSFVQNGSLKLFSGNLSLSEQITYKENLTPSAMSFSIANTLNVGKLSSNGSYSLSFKGNNKEWDLDVLSIKLTNKLEPVYFWKGRVGLELSLNTAFTYNFDNPYATSFSVNLSAEFAVAEFLSVKFAVNSANRSFYKYFENEKFSFASMFEDLFKSFDFFGDGRKSTGFNMSSLSIEFIHYMRDWNLCFSVEGKLATQSSGKSVWSPVYKIYVKWNAIPELKVEKTVDKSKED